MLYCMSMSVASCTSFNTQISNIVFPCFKTREESGFHRSAIYSCFVWASNPKINNTFCTRFAMLKWKKGEGEVQIEKVEEDKEPKIIQMYS